jgi:hypothetical protein
LGTLGDEFFLFLPKILDREVLLGTLRDARSTYFTQTLL